MKCNRSRQLLALYIEGDLPTAEYRGLDDHLQECTRCRDLASDLSESQSLVKSMRRELVPKSALLDVRRHVLNQVNEARAALGWRLKLERAVVFRFRQSYGLTGLVAILVVSAVLVTAVIWRFGIRPVPTAEESLALSNAPVVEPLTADVAPRSTLESADAVIEARLPEMESSNRVQIPEPEVSMILVEVPTLFEPREVVAMDLSSINATEEGSAAQIVKLVTDDPNVIVYWLMDDNEGGGA